MYKEIAITEKEMQRLQPLKREKEIQFVKKQIEEAEKSGNPEQIKKAYELADLAGVEINK